MGSAEAREAVAPRSAFVIEAVDIVKRYGHVEALAGANLQVRSGEVLALVGDNGAGKSTLAKVICGALAPDGGTLSFWGETTKVTSIRHAQELGVGEIRVLGYDVVVTSGRGYHATVAVPIEGHVVRSLAEHTSPSADSRGDRPGGSVMVRRLVAESPEF